MKRIFIFGGVGSGKTTLAKKLSKKLKIPNYSTDEFIYKKQWSEKYSEKERDKKFKKIADKSKWIIEGCHKGSWILPAFKKADFVILLHIKKPILFGRVIKRSFQRRKTDTPDSIKESIRLMSWSYAYKKDNFIHHQNLIKQHKRKFKILKNNRQINNFLKNLK